MQEYDRILRRQPPLLPPLPDRQARPRPAPLLLDLQGQFYDQAALLSDFQVSFDHVLQIPPMPAVVDPVTGERLIYVMHFFWGRRRPGDCHTFILQEELPQGYHFVLLSLDTAIDEVYGNLAPTGILWWGFWLWGSRLDPPCETFFAARHLPPPEGMRRPPRPLQAAQALLGYS